MNKILIVLFCTAIVVSAGIVYHNFPGEDNAELKSGWKMQLGSRRNLDKNPDKRILLPSSSQMAKGNDYADKGHANPKLENTLPSPPRKKLVSSQPETLDKLQGIWQRWKDQLATTNYQQIPIVNAELSRSLQQHPDPRIYDAIAVMLGQTELSTDKKALILDLLSEIATPEALRQLLDLADQGMESTLYLQILQAISRIGDNRWQGRYHNELSAVLTPAWQESTTHDPAFYNALAKAIASVGEPQGVNQLLVTLTTQGGNDQGLGINRIKQQAAFNAIPKVRNPDAVEVLGSWLSSESVSSPAFEVSGTALAEIGSPEATQKIIVWAKSAPAEGVRNLQSWLPKIDDIGTLQTVAATESQKTFQSPEIEAVVTQYTINNSISTLTPISTSTPTHDKTNVLQNSSTMTIERVDGH